MSQAKPIELGDIFLKNGSPTTLVVIEVDAPAGESVLKPMDGVRIATEQPSRRVPLKMLRMHSRYIRQGNVRKFGDAAYAPPPPPSPPRPPRKRDDYRDITYYLHPATEFPGGQPSPEVLAKAVGAITAGIGAAFPAADEVGVELVEAADEAGIGVDRLPRSYRRQDRELDLIREIARRAIASVVSSHRT